MDIPTIELPIQADLTSMMMGGCLSSFLFGLGTTNFLTLYIVFIISVVSTHNYMLGVLVVWYHRFLFVSQLSVCPTVPLALCHKPNVCTKNKECSLALLS